MQLNSEQNIPFVPWLPFYTLLKKEVLRFLSVSAQTIITPIITASLYLLVFGVSLGGRISLYPQFSYAQFVIPGLILMGAINNSFANTSSSLFFSRFLGNIVDLLVTPITPSQFILAYTLAAIFRGFIVGAATLCVSLFFARLPWVHPWWAFGMILMANFLFAQLGIIAAIYSNTFDALAMYTNFLIIPLIYTGGVFYPISMLPGIWRHLSQLNPLSYMIDGFRQAVLGIGDNPLFLDFGIGAGIALILFIWAAILIGRGYKLKV